MLLRTPTLESGKSQKIRDDFASPEILHSTASTKSRFMGHMLSKTSSA